MGVKPSHIPALLCVFAVALVIATPFNTFAPFESDNVQALAWADRAELSGLARVSADVYPEWRPLAYATVWLQYRLAGADRLWTFFALNVLLWIVCGSLVYVVGFALSGSAIAGLIAGIVFLSSSTLIDSLAIIVERQSSLALIFGLGAWLVVIRSGADPRALRWLLVYLLLAASALSKEYGLAFSAAVVSFAVAERRWPAAWSATLAVLSYSLVRVFLAGGALAPYCEDEGYFFALRLVCFNTTDPGVAAQGLYNIAATGIGSVLPGLFVDDGRIGISPRWLTMSAIFLWMAVIGWTRGPKAGRLGLHLVAWNAILSFFLFRFRNQMNAVAAVSIAAGVGLSMAYAVMRRQWPSEWARGLAVAALLAMLVTRAIVTRELLAERRAASFDRCAFDTDDHDREFIERVSPQYNLPECAGDSSSR